MVELYLIIFFFIGLFGGAQTTNTPQVQNNTDNKMPTFDFFGGNTTTNVNTNNNLNTQANNNNNNVFDFMGTTVSNNNKTLYLYNIKF